MAQDHIHRNGSGNIVIARSDVANKPKVGEIIHIGGHTGRVIGSAPWGDIRGVNLPADTATGFKPSQHDIAIQVMSEEEGKPKLSLYRVDAASGSRPRTFYVIAGSPGEAIGDIILGINEVGSRRENLRGLETISLVATELPSHFPLEVFHERLEPLSPTSMLFS
ncbi:MAG: hypothetical protein OXF79_22105 [Chloroflexi bacterium]|nr:hypothetical protein [Chloroflexota bacterium]